MSNRTFRIGGETEVNRIGLGTMRLTTGEGKWGVPKDKQLAIKVLKEAVDFGINLFDTADMYGPKISENIIAEALYPYNPSIVIATKGGNMISGPDKVIPNCSPNHLRNSVHASLKRLKVERIDVYHLHTVDPNVAIEYSVEELAKLRNEGKIRHLGVSNIDMANLQRALSITDIQVIQNRFSLTDRTSEELVCLAEKLNIAFLSYYPLAKGELAVSSLKKETGDDAITPVQHALLWQLNQFSNLIPIPGASSIRQMKENFTTLKFLTE